MPTLTLIYGRSHTLGSLIVRVGTLSVWGHVGVVTPERTVIEAKAWQGVVERPIGEVIAGMSHHELVDVACLEPSAGIAWARSTLGRPYDWAGVLAVPGRRDWHAADRWFCSEHAEQALVMAGRPRFRRVWRVTPGMSYEAAR